MTQFLPPNLLALFEPRDPIPFLPPVDKLPYEKKTAGYTGIASLVNQFEDPKNTPPPLRIETREERQERRRREKAELAAYKLEQDIALWNPSNPPNPAAITSDPYKTLFVARINYDTSEAKLRREFEMYGNIRKIVILNDKKVEKINPRGYAFIEYERERDMHSAYKHADGKKIDSRRVLVDVERGRTVKGWLPRRLGGGLGGTRRGGPEVNVKHSGREEARPEYCDLYRDRARPERPEHRRSRSRSRERRRRSRSRSRDRHRRDRHKRDRSRDKERTRVDHEGSAVAEKADVVPEGTGPEGAPDNESRRRRRSRSRDRDRRRRRSRSKDRKRRDYDRGDRDSRRERDRPRGDQEEMQVQITEEPKDIPEEKQESFENNGGFEEEYNNYNNNSMENTGYEGY